MIDQRKKIGQPAGQFSSFDRKVQAARSAVEKVNAECCFRSLQGLRVVIIGGTSGFGMAAAKATSAEGASVIIASSKKINVDRALADLPSGVEGYVLDITQESAVKDPR
jgi:NADPH:quinone reductase-like Zn-dependent oxidoreductase